MADQPYPVGAELEAIVAQGIADCEQSALEAAVRDDPLRLPYVALASFLKAQRALFLEVRQPLGENVIKQGVARGIAAHSAAIAKQLIRRNLTLFAGLLMASLAVGCASGYWLGSQTGAAESHRWSAWCASPSHIATIGGKQVCQVPVQ